MQQRQYWDDISLFIFLMIFPYFLAFFIHEYANLENMITCKFDHGIKPYVLALI